MTERIAKRLQALGVASRREAERMILEGRIRVDGVLVESPVLFVDETAQIFVDDEPIAHKPPRARLWLYHKPRGLLCTANDPEGRPTIYDQIYHDYPSMPRIMSVGRLDLNSEGLILLTNNPSLAHEAEHPKNGWRRCYKVRVYGKVSEDLPAQLAQGVTIDGFHYRPIEAEILEQDPRKGSFEGGRNSWMLLTLLEGKNREIRQIMEYFGLEVSRLIRLSYGPFELGNCSLGKVKEVAFPGVKDLRS